MTKKRLISYILLCFWMLLIFLSSHTTGGTSSNISGSLLEKLFTFLDENINFLYDFFFKDKDIAAAIVSFHTIFRKLAHVVTYFVLGVLSINALYVTKKPTSRREFYYLSLLSFCFCIIYSISDEFHQTFIPGRSGEARDVMIDSIGAFAGIFIYMILKHFGEIFLHKRKKD